MSDIPEPEISPNFTIEDIHKIREWNYERRKGMTPQEICEDTRKGAERFFAMRKPADPAMLDEVQRLLAAADNE
jgi:hypothetical protein